MLRKALPLLACLPALAPPLTAQLPPPPAPAGNPVTVSKARLGKALFWDEQLSATGTIACGTCHIPEAGGSDPRSGLARGATHPGFDGVLGTADDVQGSPGVPRNLADGSYEPAAPFGLGPQVTGRKANSAINAGYSPLLFWDGRADGSFEDPISGAPLLPSGAALESQAAGPPASDVEMGHVGGDWNDVATRIEGATPLGLALAVPTELQTWIAGRDYPALFDEAFGPGGVSAARAVMAIATYERTLVADQSPLDLFLGGDSGAMTPSEAAGFQVFSSPQTSCSVCHPVPFLTDETFHYLGVRPDHEDPGHFAVTGLPEHTGAMRTTHLRNVGLRAPYFHDGSAPTIVEVVEFYDRGGDFDAPHKSPLIQPLNLTQQQKDDLSAFLEGALDDPRVAQALPPFDRPTLYTESSLVPQAIAPGVAGSGGLVPRIVALEPPTVGATGWTVGVEQALGGAAALLVLSPDPDAAAGWIAGKPLPTHASGPTLRRHGPLSGSGPGAGWGSLLVTLPDGPGWLGRRLYARWLVLDPGAPAGVAASETVELVLF